MGESHRACYVGKGCRAPMSCASAPLPQNLYALAYLEALQIQLFWGETGVRLHYLAMTDSVTGTSD